MKSTRINRYPLILLALPMLLLAACGRESATTDSGSSARDDTDDASATEPLLAARDENAVYQGVFTILEDDPDTGPQLCDAVAESYPPQCSGPRAVGFDWAELPEGSYESAETGAGTTTWGVFKVTGTWDGERLRLTERPEPATYEDSEQIVEVTPQCEEPAEPWQITDPKKTTEADRTAAMDRARAAEDFAGIWIEDRGRPTEDGYRNAEGIDASGQLLVARFTGDDLAARVTEIREVWGGPLCLATAEHTYDELTAVSSQLPQDFPQFTSWSVDERANTVTTGTWVVTPALQAELDERFRPGMVTAVGWLQPVDDSGSGH
jgi:hypothetical protein